MNVTIQEQKKLPHLEREEVRATASYEGTTPSRNEFRKEIAKASKAKPEQVIVRRITPDFGTTSAVIEASVYNSVDALKSIEQKYMQERHAKEEPKEEAQEAPAEEKKEEAPAKDKKEEAEEESSEDKEEAPAQDEKTEESKDSKESEKKGE